MGPSKSLCILIRSNESLYVLCVLMGVYGFLYMFMRFFVSSWVFMDPYASIWVLMGPYKSL